MRFRCPLLVVLTAVTIAVPSAARAQQQREVSVGYLRAAAGALADHASVVLTATYLPNPGLVEVHGWYLRGHGYARFSVKDSRSGQVFTSMYCQNDGKAFKDLVEVVSAKPFRFYGYKASGETDEDAIFVTSVEAYTEPTTAPVEGKPAATVGPYRVTITDLVTSNRTVLANVLLGQPYAVGGLSIVIEPEQAEGVGAIGP